MENLQHKRRYSLDLLRVIGAIAVVLTHCCGGFMSDYQAVTIEFRFANLLNSFSRLGVPIFLMISGALFLDEKKEVTLKGIFSKNIKSLAIITLVWAILYSLLFNLVLEPWISGTPIRMKSIIAGIINGHFHMWYLYLIIGLYIAIPFIKKFVSLENKNMVLFFILFSFGVKFLLPQISMIFAKLFDIGYVNTFVEQFHLDFFSGMLTYLLVGWYIVHVGIPQKWIQMLIYVLGAGSIAFIIAYVHLTGDYERAYANIGAPVFLYSVSVFLAMNSIKLNWNDKKLRRVTGLSKLTLGVYLIHPMLITVYKNLIVYKENPMVYIPVEFVIITCASFLVSWLISKTPVLKKLIKA